MNTKKTVLCAALALSLWTPTVFAEEARDIVQASGIQGGLVVHLNCGEGILTAGFRTHDGYLVHGLDTDAQTIHAARTHIKSLGKYGPVSINTFEGQHLPYTDGLVNLLIAENLGDVPFEECLRVLSPHGVALIPASSAPSSTANSEKIQIGERAWFKIVKPWPEEIDEWTHQLHGPGGNAVSSDRVVGPPTHLRWTDGPLWARSHGWTPSVSAMVSSNGRLFCICDETLPCVDGTVPSQWFLVARDAFSGVLLWKRRIPTWDSKHFSGTPDASQGVNVGRFTMPPNLGKRLVAVDDTVFITLGVGAPVTALDAATGEPKRVYDETLNADEILCVDGRLVVSINPTGDSIDGAPAKQVCAMDVPSGRRLWKKGPFPGIRASKNQDPRGRLELSAGDGMVFLLTTKAIECLDTNSGETVWRIDRPSLPDSAVTRVGFAAMYEYLLTVMVYHDGVVLLAQPEPNTHHTYHTMPGTLYAFDARNGRQMWKHAYGGWGHCTPPDVFVVGDLVWTHVNAETEFGSVWGKGYKAKDSSQVDYRIQALDLRTGQLRQELSTKDIFNVGHHHRCYRNRTTERFLLSCRRGVEFVDLATGDNYQNHWVRSGCLLGYLPCNGLLYVTPHPCSCYINAKLTGFNALEHKNAKDDVQRTKDEGRRTKREERLVKGPAYGDIDIRPSSFALRTSTEWPSYRHDARRSGATEEEISANLGILWQVDVGPKPSALVVAGGKVLVASVDTHTVHALSAENGQSAWTYTAGARVDSPPTFHNGLAIFGSSDGQVHCLRAADGALVWRFDAAPQRRLVTAFGQLESAWPVPGSVLVHDGKCWAAAGRSSYLDGGICLYALDPVTGKVLYEETIYSPDPDTGKMTPVTDASGMQGLLNDVLATDGTDVFIRQERVASFEGQGGQHLFTNGGYLDPSWFNRTFWQVGQAKTSGLMVLGKDVAYGVEVYDSNSREAVFQPGAKAYRLRCMPLKREDRGASGARATVNRRRQLAVLWQQRLDIRVSSMVRAGDTIFVAGSPDIVDPQDPHGAWEGRKGGLLAAYAAADGQPKAEYRLPTPPVWDGMSAANGCLYVSTLDGRVICLAAKGT